MDRRGLCIRPNPRAVFEPTRMWGPLVIGRPFLEFHARPAPHVRAPRHRFRHRNVLCPNRPLMFRLPRSAADPGPTDVPPDNEPSAGHVTGGFLPESSETRKKTRNRTNRTCAIHACAPIIPPKPSMPAAIATARNIKAHAIIGNTPLVASLRGRSEAFRRYGNQPVPLKVIILVYSATYCIAH